MQETARLTDWPTYGLASDVRPLLARALAARWPAAMVTLYGAEGAAPLGVGAQMLFTGGERAGFLSGGCVEGDVALHAAAVLADGQARRLVYGRGGPPDIQLLCGSRISLLVESVDAAAAANLVAEAAARRPALWLSDGRSQVCLTASEPSRPLPPLLERALEAASQSTAPAGGDGTAIWRRFDPRPRLVLVGGDPIALATAQLAVQAGFDTVLVRPKGPASPPPLPGVRYLRQPADEALATLALDPWTAVAAASHDLEADHAALATALPSPALYVGALGSRRRVPERLVRLRASGVAEAELKRLVAPIGLDIGARSPWEIAVSILAEVIAAFRAQDARRTWPAHARPAVPHAGR